MLLEPVVSDDGAGCPGAGVAPPPVVPLVCGNRVRVLVPFRSGDTVAVPLAAGTYGVVHSVDSEGDAKVFMEALRDFVVVFSEDFGKLLVGD